VQEALDAGVIPDFIDDLLLVRAARHGVLAGWE